MKVAGVWELAALVMDTVAYLVCCFRRKLLEDARTDEQAEKHDTDYFRSYADIAVHEEMLSDTVRTNAYRYAILKNYEKIRGKIVADVGAGTGILSVFCVQAGAKKDDLGNRGEHIRSGLGINQVYAIEASDMASQTQAVAMENKMVDRIDVINNRVEDVFFPEKLDVIVSEWMGYCLLYESMLPSVIECRDRWLKKGGMMLPCSATLYLAPFSDNDYNNRLDFWSEIRSVYKMSMETMRPYAQKCIARRARACEQYSASQICHFDLNHVTLGEIHKVKKDFTFQCFGHSKIHGFTTWFSVGFPDGVTLTTSPYSEETHWSQTLFYLDEPLTASQDTVIKGSISIQPHPDAPRFLDVNITYQLGDGPWHHKYYFMNDCIT